ncbi:hypothetical protein B0J11DRAFT_438590 [Dendryphion nanum]|uniref:Uncharacterized protein n=1 Tax=Dendryphion nanum TaxID=256645 RepID=A0A9P9DKY4_9PLEO|nr:hypothetical protein B0J11DRAFT_438590 [Dendryphion nanum]
MSCFLNFPREIRDMIYAAILTEERPRPTLGEADWLFKYRRVFEPASARRGEYGCAYSLDEVPRTCANFMACNRQVHEEMKDAIFRAKKKGDLAAKLDCIAEDESFHYFTWLGISLVKTSTPNPVDSRPSFFPGWADRLLEKYRQCPQWTSGSGHPSCQSSSTLINELWVDIRIFGDRSGKWFRNTSPPDRTSWALCAAVKRILEKGPDFSRMEETANTVTVEELVLNVVTPPNVPKEKYLSEDYPLDGTKGGLVHPRTVAKELVDVWNKIWSGDEIKGVYYQVLLERVQRVRVCVDGDTYRVRELRLELERGQAERRRIAARVGW